MRDENNTPIDMPAEIEMSPEQPFFDAIHENMDVTRNSPKFIRKAAKACLVLATAQRIEAENALQAEIEKLADRLTAMTVAFHETQNELKRAEEIYTKAGEGMAGEVERLKNELSDLSEAHARLVEDNGKLWKDNAELHGINTGLKEARYRLASVIEDLAAVIRNS